MLVAVQQAGPNQYALGHSERELDRLSLQAHVFEPFTRQLFRDAGLASGMRSKRMISESQWRADPEARRWQG